MRQIGNDGQNDKIGKMRKKIQNILLPNYNNLAQMSVNSPNEINDLLNVSKSGFKKHQIMQMYKESEKQKSILKNKLNILKSECDKYHRKTKSIQSSLKKVNKIKENYKINKAQVQESLRLHKLKEEQKIRKVKQVKQENRGKLPMIKSWLQRQKTYDCLLVKRQRKAIEQKIRVFRNTIVSQRRNTATKIKEQQQMVPFNRTLYMQLRSKNARMHEQEQALKIERKFKKSRLQLQEMKNLEDALLEKLNKSRTKLNQSMTKLHKSIRV